jgi:hypothetical protein
MTTISAEQPVAGATVEQQSTASTTATDPITSTPHGSQQSDQGAGCQAGTTWTGRQCRACRDRQQAWAGAVTSESVRRPMKKRCRQRRTGIGSREWKQLQKTARQAWFTPGRESIGRHPWPADQDRCCRFGRLSGQPAGTPGFAPFAVRAHKPFRVRPCAQPSRRAGRRREHAWPAACRQLQPMLLPQLWQR